MMQRVQLYIEYKRGELSLHAEGNYTKIKLDLKAITDFLNNKKQIECEPAPPQLGMHVSIAHRAIPDTTECRRDSKMVPDMINELKAKNKKKQLETLHDEIR